MSASESFLVELTVAIVKKKKLFATTFLLVLVTSIGYIFVTPPVYEYVTLVKLAQDGEGALLESRESVLANIKSRWLPGVKGEFKNQWGHTPKFNVRVTEVGKNHVFLSSVAPAKAAEGVNWVHTALAERLISSQSELERIASEKLNAQIDVAERLIGSGQIAVESESPGAAIVKDLMTIRGRLAGMQSVEARAIAQQTGLAHGIGMPLAIALVLVQSLIASVAVVLFYYFIKQVNRAVQSEEERP